MIKWELFRYELCIVSGKSSWKQNKILFWNVTLFTFFFRHSKSRSWQQFIPRWTRWLHNSHEKSERHSISGMGPKNSRKPKLAKTFLRIFCLGNSKHTLGWSGAACCYCLQAFSDQLDFCPKLLHQACSQNVIDINAWNQRIEGK